MGSYIGIGLVFNNKFNSKEKSTLQMILEYFTSKNGKLLNAKFSEDEDGNDWKDIENLKLYEVDNLLNKYYLNINFICDILDEKNVMVRAHYENLNENVSGLLLNFEEQLFINDYPDERIKEITNQFIDLIVDIYNVVEYDYALCDQEAMIEYTLADIEKAKKEYSILLIPYFNKMEIIKNSWNIDGLTDRFDTGVEYISIKHICPICNEYKFDDEYDICPICNWEHDLVQENDEDFSGGANELSVKEARILYKLQKFDKELTQQILNKHQKAIQDINNSCIDNNSKMIKNKIERNRYAEEIIQKYKERKCYFEEKF